MIEKIVLNYLKTKLEVDVYLEKPKDKSTFVLLEKTGSSSENHIFTAMFAVQSYATSMEKAALLNENVKKAMDEIIELDDVARCDLNSDYNFTDTSTKQYRYQAVFDLVHY